MHIPKRTAIAVALAGCSVVVVFTAAACRHSEPLGARPNVDFPPRIAQATRDTLLSGDFKVTTDAREMPTSVLKTFQEEGGVRLVLANPGERFEATDVITDASEPRNRLIFAGASADEAFVHYERGGFAHSYPIEVFSLEAQGVAKPLWRGSCSRPATDLKDLRSMVASDDCH